MDGVKKEDIKGDCKPRMDSGVVVKREPAWPMEEDSSDQPSCTCSTTHPTGPLLSPKREFVCQHCSADFVLVSSLELHLASVHREPLPFHLWTESSDKMMSLPHATEETKRVRKYSADSDVDYVVKWEPAQSTEEDSSDDPSAIYNAVQTVSDNSSLQFLDQAHQCYLCPSAFVLVSSLELHLASVHSEKLFVVLPELFTPYGCDAGNHSNTDIDNEVDRLVTTKKVVKKDAKDKDGKKRKKVHVCDVCGKSFALGHHLKRHKSVHTCERPYKCPHCDSNFKHLGDLQRHTKSVHERVKPNVCDVCGAAFFQTGELKQHRRIHTGEKPHVCSDCGKSFAHSSNLRQHRLTHTGKRPHVCSDCGKGFFTSTHLARHCLVHSGERPHICPHCAYACATSHNLKAHMARKH